MLDHLTHLENKTIYILREAYAQFCGNMALLWSIGKDSTTLLWIARKAFFGKIPFPVLHIDTSYKFKEIYEFRQKWAKKWQGDLFIAKNDQALSSGMNHRVGRLECCHALKTESLRNAVKKFGFEALFLAIRRDEHGIRAKERYFSPRGEDMRWDYLNQPPELLDLYLPQSAYEQHIRVHPLLSWSEIDVWEYIKKEKIPVLPLYF